MGAAHNEQPAQTPQVAPQRHKDQTMLEQQNSIAIAVIKTEMEYLKAGMTDLKMTNAAQTEKIEQLLAIVAEARGGWRTLLMLGGAAGAIGSGITWLATHWRP